MKQHTHKERERESEHGGRAEGRREVGVIGESVTATVAHAYTTNINIHAR